MRIAGTDPDAWGCRRCGILKPASAYRLKTGRARREKTCIACQYARHSAWYVTNRETILPKKRVAALAWNRANSERHRKRSSDWYYANPERAAEQGRRWRAAHKDEEAFRKAFQRFRRRQMPGTASQAAIRARVALWGHRCWLCRAPYKEIDHVIAVARGGTNWPANLRPICTPCNRHNSAKNWRLFVNPD